MTANSRSSSTRWRSRFLDDLTNLAGEAGMPPALIRVLGWLIVCDPPEQSAQQLRTRLHLSAGAVSEASRTLIAMGMVDRIAHPGDRRTYYRARSQGWEQALEQRLRTVTHLRAAADRAIAAAGPEADDRLCDMRDLYAWFGNEFELLLTRWRSEIRPIEHARS